MKKMYLLSGMVMLGVTVTIHTKSIKNPQVRKIVRQINEYTKKLDKLTLNGQVSNWPAVFNILNSNKINVNEYFNPDGYTLLGIAVETRDLTAAQTLLETYKADPNKGEMTALMIACENEDVPMVELLLKHGGDIYKKDPRGYDSRDYIFNNRFTSGKPGHPEDVNLDILKLFVKYHNDTASLQIIKEFK